MKWMLAILAVCALSASGCVFAVGSGGCREPKPRSGTHIEYHANGVKKSEEVWEDGVLVRRTDWDDKGNKTSETFNNPVSNDD